MKSSGNPISDPLQPLNLPAAIRAQTAELLQAINRADTTVETMCGADRVECFTWALKPCAR